MQRFTMPVAVHVFLVDGDRVLLLRRFGTGYEDGKFSVVAGHLDGGEEVVAAVMREAREEVGIELAREDVRVVSVMHRRAEEERIDFFVVAERWVGDVWNREPEKCDELSWHRISCLPEHVIPYVRAALENWVREIGFASFGWDG